MPYRPRWTSIVVKEVLLFYSMVHLFPANHRATLAFPKLVSLRDDDADHGNAASGSDLFRQDLIYLLHTSSNGKRPQR